MGKNTHSWVITHSFKLPHFDLGGRGIILLNEPFALVG
jgi:hypothetical protein